MSEKGRVEEEGRVIVGCWPVKERGPPGCKKSADGVQPCRRFCVDPGVQRNREWEERLLLITPRTIAACINPQKSFFTILLFHSRLTRTSTKDVARRSAVAAQQTAAETAAAEQRCDQSRRR